MPHIEPSIAVLLAAYNGVQWLEEQLNSIQAQVGVAVTIFISVDPSTDGTEAWCDRYAKGHSNVALLPPDRPCSGAARNFFHLIRNTDLRPFDLVALADQDDRWHREKLRRAARCLDEYAVDAYSSNVTAFWPDGSTRILNKAQPQVRWDHHFEAAGPGCTYVLKKNFATFLQRKVQKQWPQLQEVTLHDWYIYALARTNEYSWYIDPIPGMDYRQHSNNQVGANVGWAALVSRYRTIKSGWWLGQVKLIEDLTNQDRGAGQRPAWRQLRRTDLLALSLRATQCRRRRRDQLFFGILCMATAVVGAKIK